MNDAAEIPRRLEDGSAPMTAAAFLAHLESLGISHTTTRHPPVFTVEESKALCGDLPGAHTKNLFLRNKKGRMWLLTCLEDRRVDLKGIGRTIGAGAFSFASADRLMRYLGVIPGAVTPFAVINDRTNAVRVILDRALIGIAPLNFHPLDNAMTTSLAPEDLVRFLDHADHSPDYLDFDALDIA